MVQNTHLERLRELSYGEIDTDCLQLLHKRPIDRHYNIWGNATSLRNKPNAWDEIQEVPSPIHKHVPFSTPADSLRRAGRRHIDPLSDEQLACQAEELSLIVTWRDDEWWFLYLMYATKHCRFDSRVRKVTILLSRWKWRPQKRSMRSLPSDVSLVL